MNWQEKLEQNIIEVINHFVKNKMIFTCLEIGNYVKNTLLHADYSEIRDVVNNLYVFDNSDNLFKTHYRRMVPLELESGQTVNANVWIPDDPYGKLSVEDINKIYKNQYAKQRKQHDISRRCKCDRANLEGSNPQCRLCYVEMAPTPEAKKEAAYWLGIDTFDNKLTKILDEFSFDTINGISWCLKNEYVTSEEIKQEIIIKLKTILNDLIKNELH